MGWGQSSFNQAKREETPNFANAAYLDASSENAIAMQEQQARADAINGAMTAAMVYNYGMGPDKSPIADFAKSTYNNIFPSTNPLTVPSTEAAQAQQMLGSTPNSVGPAVLDPTSVAANVQAAEAANAAPMVLPEAALAEGMGGTSAALGADAAGTAAAAETGALGAATSGGAGAGGAAATTAPVAGGAVGGAGAGGGMMAGAGAAVPWVAAAVAADQILFDGAGMDKIMDWGSGLGEMTGLWS